VDSPDRKNMPGKIDEEIKLSAKEDNQNVTIISYTCTGLLQLRRSHYGSYS